MDPLTREALKHVQEAMQVGRSVWEVELPTEFQVKAEPEKWTPVLMRHHNTARSDAFPRILSHLALASPSLDGDWRKFVQAFENLVHAQDRMFQLGDAPSSSREWRDEYRDCVRRNRRYGHDMDKYLLRACRRSNIIYDEDGFYLEEPPIPATGIKDHMRPKKSIHLEWDAIATLRHRITLHGGALPRNNDLAWILAPSAPLLLAHQFGAMKPSHGLIVSNWVLDMVFNNRYVLMPINSALAAARVDIHYTRTGSARLTFHPKHALFANSDSLEEGVRQLLNNYSHYVYSQLDEYLSIVFRTMATTATAMYHTFLHDQLAAGTIGRGRDTWSMAFPSFAAWLVDALSLKYSVIEGEPDAETEDWARKQTDHILEEYSRVKSSRDSLLTALGLY